jgi:hypothetical protein
MASHPHGQESAGTDRSLAPRHQRAVAEGDLDFAEFVATVAAAGQVASSARVRDDTGSSVDVTLYERIASEVGRSSFTTV